MILNHTVYVTWIAYFQLDIFVFVISSLDDALICRTTNLFKFYFKLCSTGCFPDICTFFFYLQCWRWISCCHLLFWKFTFFERLSTWLLVPLCKYNEPKTLPPIFHSYFFWTKLALLICGSSRRGLILKIHFIEVYLYGNKHVWNMSWKLEKNNKITKAQEHQTFLCALAAYA